MEFEIPKSKVYVLLDGDRIVRCEGGYTTPADLTGWIEIDEGTGDKYNLCQSHYFDGGLYTEDGIPRYEWDGEKTALRSDEELEADRSETSKPEPTTIEARVAALEADAEQAALDRAALTLLLTGEETG